MVKEDPISFFFTKKCTNYGPTGWVYDILRAGVAPAMGAWVAPRKKWVAGTFIVHLPHPRGPNLFGICLDNPPSGYYDNGFGYYFKSWQPWKK